MRLIHATPESLINRTIIYRHCHWRVDAASEGHLHMTWGPKDTPGRLSFAQIQQCRLYPTNDEIAKTYPRLIKLLCKAAFLTKRDAEDALRGYLTTGPRYMGTETVARLGGAAIVITHVVSRRHLTLQRPGAVIRSAKTARALIEA